MGVEDLEIDLGVVRGLDYYTGMVFEAEAPALGAEKQICGGESYTLSELFGGEKVFSTVFAIGFDRILLALDTGEMCVCDISETLGMSMSATSHQLRMLREAHLVSSRREGKNIFYSLCDDHVRVVLETAVEHLSE